MAVVSVTAMIGVLTGARHQIVCAVAAGIIAWLLLKEKEDNNEVKDNGEPTADARQ